MPPLPFLESRRVTVATAVLSLALGWTAHRYVTAVHEAGPWALLCLFTGLFSLLQVAIALLRRPPQSAQTWPAWAAALLAAATLAAGAAGTADARRKTEELVVFVDRAFAGEHRDNEEAEIQTSYARYTGYAAGRTCALLGLGLGLPALALSLLCLERARRVVSRAEGQSQPQAESKAAAQGLSPVAWLGLSGFVGVAALAAAAIAATRPVPWAENPEVAEAALLERRFASGDLDGACHLLEPALQTTSEAAEKAIAKRVSDLPGKASRCVEREIQRARKQGAAGCAAMVSVLGPMRFVHIAGKQEQIESACEGLE